MVDDGGGCSRCRRRSSPPDLPSTAATHRREEDDEAERLDNLAKLEDERFTGDVWGTSATVRVRVRVWLRERKRERVRESERMKLDEDISHRSYPLRSKQASKQEVAMRRWPCPSVHGE